MLTGPEQWDYSSLVFVIAGVAVAVKEETRLMMAVLRYFRRSYHLLPKKSEIPAVEAAESLMSVFLVSAPIP